MESYQNIRKPELLMPAKDLEVLRTAVRYGADVLFAADILEQFFCILCILAHIFLLISVGVSPIRMIFV